MSDHSSADATGMQLVTMRIHNQFLSIPVEDVREIAQGQKIMPVPLVPPEIAGMLNLRGRIVTLVDIRHRLGLPLRDPGAKCLFVVVEHKGDLYGLIVDSVDEVLTIPSASVQNPPPNQTQNWREITAGVYPLEHELLVILDPKPLCTFG